MRGPDNRCIIDAGGGDDCWCIIDASKWIDSDHDASKWIDVYNTFRSYRTNLSGTVLYVIVPYRTVAFQNLGASRSAVLPYRTVRCRTLSYGKQYPLPPVRYGTDSGSYGTVPYRTMTNNMSCTIKYYTVPYTRTVWNGTVPYRTVPNRMKPNALSSTRIIINRNCNCIF